VPTLGERDFDTLAFNRDNSALRPAYWCTTRSPIINCSAMNFAVPAAHRASRWD